MYKIHPERYNWHLSLERTARIKSSGMLQRNVHTSTFTRNTYFSIRADGNRSDTQQPLHVLASTAPALPSLSIQSHTGTAQ